MYELYMIFKDVAKSTENMQLSERLVKKSEHYGRVIVDIQ